MDREINNNLTFEETLSRLEAEQRLDPAVIRTADYLMAASLLDDEKEVLHDAIGLLMKEDPRELYFAFLKECFERFKNAKGAEQYKYARQLDDVAIMGLGVWQEDMGLISKSKGMFEVATEPDWDMIKYTINKVIYGDYFIEEYNVPKDNILWGTDFPLRMSACDASQHRGKLKVPFNKTWATPIIVNNSAGTIKEQKNDNPKWKHIAVPKDTREYEDWVIIGPDDYAELDDSDYEWAAKSSMDVGQFFVEETFIFKHGGLTQKPDVHFRDGRIFPQDKLMNCTIENRHGQLTREAIYRMVSTIRAAKELKILYCGVAKQVQLKIYSTIINWYINNIMGQTKWNPTGRVISDTEIMRNLICMKEFSSSFEKIYVTCPIVRKFETVSNLNRRTRRQVQNDLNRLDRVYHSRDITALDVAKEALKTEVVMFFAGHICTDEHYIPRYEFVKPYNYKDEHIKTIVNKILSALRLASFSVDEDHLRQLEEPITTLVPTPILVAHDLSKQMGEEIASNFAQRVMAEYIKRLRDKRSS
jgi:hypothetical protein